MNKKILIVVITLIVGYILYIIATAFLANKVGGVIIEGFKNRNTQVEESEKKMGEEMKKINDRFKYYTDSLINVENKKK